jgi:hypothetical protein
MFIDAGKVTLRSGLFMRTEPILNIPAEMRSTLKFTGDCISAGKTEAWGGGMFGGADAAKSGETI